MRKRLPLRQPLLKIFVMTAAGLLVIFCTRSYTPVITITEPEKTENTGAPASQKPPELLSQMTDGWSTALSVVSDRLKLDREPVEYEPSVLNFNLMHHFPDAVENFENKSLYTFINNPSELAGMVLKPIYERLEIPYKNNAKDSYGAQMQEYLNKKDVSWTSDLYQWIQAEPVKAASMKSLPASAVTGGYNPANPKHEASDPSTWLIPSWKNINILFSDGSGNPIELYSNAKEILSMASVNTYFTDWKDTDAFESYIDALWDNSHRYSVSLSSVYYCDGCELPPEKTQDETKDEMKDETQKENETSAPLFVEAPKPSESAVSPELSLQVEKDSENQLKAAESAPDVSEAVSEASKAAADAGKVSGPAEEAALADVHADSSTTENVVSKLDNAENNAEAKQNSIDAAVSTPAAVSNAEAEGAGEATVAARPVIYLNSEGKYCPGHVDLTIQAQILGIKGKTNLFTADKVSNQFWTPYRISYVHQLNEQDWFEKYNLSGIQLGIGTPLTSAEITNYLDMLPEDISQERRAVVVYALNSVGKIPYYYGGKPSAAGYTNNHFSSLTQPDKKGRVLSGLDCSGWINWVYWSSIGKKLNGLGTSGLIHEGRAIKRSDLKPGDILVKPGIDSHVVMFLSWTADGSMICIHETGSRVNNVTVSTLNTSWPYYRAILD